jgi:hypothetical protein
VRSNSLCRVLASISSRLRSLEWTDFTSASSSTSNQFLFDRRDRWAGTLQVSCVLTKRGLLFERRVGLLDGSSFFGGSGDFTHAAHLVLQLFRSMIIHPLDGAEIGLLGIAREPNENKGRKGEGDADPRGPKCRRSGIEKDEFPKGTVNASHGERNFGHHEEACKAVEREGQVDKDDSQDGDHKTLEVTLGDTVAHTGGPEFIEPLSAHPPMANEAHCDISDIQDKGILLAYPAATRQRRGHQMG